MAKASERKGPAAERECCAETRRQQLASIRENFLTFPVIRSIPCPTCRKVLHISVYERPADETGGSRG